MKAKGRPYDSAHYRRNFHLGDPCLSGRDTGVWRGEGVKVYESFVEGAKGGFQMAIRIIPYLVAILVAVGMLRGAGGIDLLAQWLDPVLRRVGFPVEILPLAILRPLSGSGSLGIVTELVQVHGPDSLSADWQLRLTGAPKPLFMSWQFILERLGLRKHGMR